MDNKKTVELTPQDFALLGEGALGYIREIEINEAQRLLGAQPSVAPDSKLFCLYNADGTALIGDYAAEALGAGLAAGSVRMA